jgi:hypothetical protein
MKGRIEPEILTGPTAMSSRRPIGSVLIPAHNEGPVIGRTYIALGGSARSKRDESSPTVTAGARDARTDS